MAGSASGWARAAAEPAGRPPPARRNWPRSLPARHRAARAPERPPSAPAPSSRSRRLLVESLEQRRTAYELQILVLGVAAEHVPLHIGVVSTRVHRSGDVLVEVRLVMRIPAMA